MSKELDRARRVADMLISMHGWMRDSYAARARALDLILLASSVLLAGAVFIDPAIARELFGTETRGSLLTGALSLLILFLSLAGLIVKWKERAAQHDLAAREYAKLLQGVRSIDTEDNGAQQAWILEFGRIGESLVHVPQRRFNGLKQKHERKIALSKAISSSPYASRAVLILRLWLRGNRDVIRGDDGDSQTSQ